MYIILDGNNLAHRTWHTPPVNSEVIDDSLEVTLQLFMHSFASVLTNIVGRVDRFRPRFTKLIICWDGANAAQLRKKIYAPYKENRATERAKAAKTDKPSLPAQLVTMLRAELRAVNARYDICFHDAEADDLMALLCEVLDGEQICLVTRDRDMCQLVNHNVKILDVFANKLIGPQDVADYFGVGPEGVVEIKALMGDTSDNYPGLKGIGPKKGLALYQAGNTREKYPELDVFRKLATIPFPELDTDAILSKLADTDLDAVPNWDVLGEKFGLSEYVISRLYSVV